MATTELRSAWAVAAAVTGPVKVRVARYLRDSGVFTSRPKWDKSGSLLSCVHKVLLGSRSRLDIVRGGRQGGITPVLGYV